MESPAMTATARGRNSGSSTVRAASATNKPLPAMSRKKSGPPACSLLSVTLTETAIRIGTIANTPSPARLRRRRKIKPSSELRKRPVGWPRRAAGTGAWPAPVGTAAVSAVDIEALPGERDEHIFQRGLLEPQTQHGHTCENERRRDLLRCHIADRGADAVGTCFGPGQAQFVQHTDGVVVPVGGDVHPGRPGCCTELVDGALRHQAAGVHDPDVAADLF